MPAVRRDRRHEPPWLRVVRRWKPVTMSLREVNRRAGWSEGRASGYRRARDIGLRQVCELAFALGTKVGSLAAAIAIEMGPVRVNSIPGPSKRASHIRKATAGEVELQKALAEESPVRWRPGKLIKEQMRRSRANR